MSTRIMVVDDSQELLDLFRELLTDEGYEVVLNAVGIQDIAEVERRLSKREARPPVPRSCPAINLLIHLSRTCDCRSFPCLRQFPVVYLRKCHALSFSVLPIALVRICCGRGKGTG